MDEMILSTAIPFERLSNTRDLGGMIGFGGKKIVPGKLIRSGNLSRASEADKVKMAEMLSTIVDFRSEVERREQPDPVIDGVENLPIQAVEDKAPGVTREQESDQMIVRMMKDREIARNYMLQTYRDVITSEFSLSQYGKFLKVLLEGRPKAILWHCTAGKDRAGMAAFFVEMVLGVPEEVIRADYMSSNDHLAKEVAVLAKMIAQQLGDPDPVAIEYMFGAKEEYLELVEETVKEAYGNYDGFLRKGLKLTDEDIEKLRSMYLE